MSITSQPGPAPALNPGDPSPPSTPLSWEGDRMFNIYIYDYCNKRGFIKTARELVAEADIHPESMPPINAKQGLLFEWWSVFWVLFTAKSNGSGTDEALLYTQHQAQQAAQRQAQQRMQSQVPVNRFMNGMPRQPGLLPNGVPSVQGQMQPSFTMPAPGQQPNGMPGSVGAPSVQGAPPQPPFQPLLANQRPPPLAPQQRVPNGMPPFQSPTMAHSPSSGAPQPAPMGQLGPSPPMSQVNRGGMLPPTLQGAMGGAQSGTPMQSFSQMRPPTPAGEGQGTMMTQPSPSLSARQTPGGMPPGGDMRHAQEVSIMTDLSRLNPAQLASIKQEVGLGDKDIHLCTLEEKHRILTKARSPRNVKGTPQGGPNAVAGPSNPSMQPPSQRHPQSSIPPPLAQQQQRANKRNSTSPGDEDTLVLKQEGSPPDRKRVRRSPLGMEQNTLLMSYPHGSQQGAPQQIPNGMMRPPLSGQPMSGGFPPQPGMPNMGNIPMGAQMGVGQMGNAMSPGMSHPGNPAGMMGAQGTQQQYQIHYRQPLHAMHKGGMPPGVMNNVMSSAGSPSSSDPTFNPNAPPGQGPQQFPGGVASNTRLAQNKAMGMMPPPSPVMNPAHKDHPSANKDIKPGVNPAGHPPSPRNPPNGQAGSGPGGGGAGQQGGTAPPTPVSAPNSNMTAPSPSALLGNPGSTTMNGPLSSNQSASMGASTADTIPSNLFGPDFIQSVASSLDEFDPSIFRPTGGDLTFERDFEQWFNPDGVGATLDLK